MLNVKKWELTVLLVFSIIMVGIVLLPDILGVLWAPAGSQYMITAHPVDDANAYASWIQQAAQGKFGFEINYTTEHHRPIFFHPLFLIIGLAIRFFYFSLTGVWYVIQGISVILSIVPLYYLISYFIEQKKWRWITLLVTIFSGGLGWIVYFSNNLFPNNLLPVDYLWPEVTFFQSLQWPFIFNISLGLICLTFLLFLRALRENRFQFAALAGICAFLLNLIHPYDIMIVYSVLLVYYFLMTEKKNWNYFFIFFGISFLPSLYHLWVLTDPVFFAHSRFEMFSGHPLTYLFGFGFIFFTALLTVILILKKKVLRYYFLIVWFFVQLAILYFPIVFQRRLVMGIVIPMALLTTVFFQELAKRQLFILNRFFKTTLLVLFFIIISLTSVTSYAYRILALDQKNFPEYMPNEIINGFNWLTNNTNMHDVVLSSWMLGNYIPAYSGNKVYIGHGAQTINATEKYRVVVDFFNNVMNKNEKENFLHENEIKYIFFTDYDEDKFGGAKWEDDLISDGAIKLVYSNQNAKIFAININSLD